MADPVETVGDTEAGTSPQVPTTSSGAVGLGGQATEEGIATPGTGGEGTGLVAATRLGDVGAGADQPEEADASDAEGASEAG